jgi:hypothetical protein
MTVTPIRPPADTFPDCGCPRGTAANDRRSESCEITYYDDGPRGVRGQHRRYFKRIPCQSLAELGLVPADHPDADEAACECGQVVGGIHHIGCDLETCPVCGCPALGCYLMGSHGGFTSASRLMATPFE